MLRYIERMLDVEWLLFIIAALLFMLVLDMLTKRRTSTRLVEHQLDQTNKALSRNIELLKDIDSKLYEMEFRDGRRFHYELEEWRQKGFMEP